MLLPHCQYLHEALWECKEVVGKRPVSCTLNVAARRTARAFCEMGDAEDKKRQKKRGKLPGQSLQRGQFMRRRKYPPHDALGESIHKY